MNHKIIDRIVEEAATLEEFYLQQALQDLGLSLEYLKENSNLFKVVYLGGTDHKLYCYNNTVFLEVWLEVTSDKVQVFSKKGAGRIIA